MALLTKSKESINQVDSKLYEHLAPEIAFAHYKNGHNLLVKTNEKVLKDQKILQNKQLSVFSPISGVIEGMKKTIDANGSIINCIQIKNDFKEKVDRRVGSRRNLSNINKEELIRSLIEHSVPNLYRHNSYLFEFIHKYLNADKLIVSGVDLEPHFFADSFIMKDYLNEILDITDALIETLKIKKCYLVLKNTDNDNITNYTEYLGTYPKIKLRLVSANYPGGLDHNLKKELFGPDVKMDEILFLGCQNLIAIYESLKRNRNIHEKYITITGPVVENPKVIKVKIGSYMLPIINQFIKLKSTKDLIFYANGHVCGVEVDINNYCISAASTGVYITTKSASVETDCINCGKCNEKCPVGVNPKYIMDNINNKDLIKKSNIKECINCGLCTYICPSNINLKNYLKRGIYEE